MQGCDPNIESEVESAALDQWRPDASLDQEPCAGDCQAKICMPQDKAEDPN